MATEDTKLILAISADITQLRRAMRDAGVEVKRTTDAVNDNFKSIGPNADQAAQRIEQSMARAGRQAQQATRNIGFQLNDITQGLMSGTSPFTIMAQQTSQVVQALDGLDRGVSKVAAFGTALRSMFSMQTLLVGGAILAFGYLTQAVIDYFTKGEESAEDFNKTLNDQIDVVNRLREALDLPAAKLAGTEEERFVATREAMAKNTEIAGQLAERLNEIRDAILSVPADAFEGQTATIYALDAALIKLEQDMKAGNVDFLEFARTMEEIEQRKNLPEDIQKLVTEVADLAAKGALTNRVLQELRKTLDGSAAAAKSAEERQKTYTEAIKEIQQIAEPALNEVQRILEQHKIALENASSAADIYAANLAKTNALTELGAQAASQFATAALGGLDDYSRIVAQLESGGRANAQNPMSSASGLFQFIDSTFEKMIPYLKSLPQFAALTTEQIRAQKNNVDIQKAAFDEFTRQNAAVLAKHGASINHSTLYMAHVLGAGGAARLLRADPNRPVAQVVGPTAAAQNPTLLGNRTVAEAIAAFERKVGGAGARVGAAGIQEENAALREQAQIRGEINHGIDQTVAKQEAAAKFAELMREAQKKAAEQGRTLTTLETQELRKQADEYGRLQGMKAAAKQAESFQGRLQSLRDENALLTQQVTQLGASTVAIDQNRVAQEAANEALQIEQALRSQGVAVTAAQSQAILQQTTAIATAKAQVDAFQNSQKQLTAAQQRYNQQVVQTAQTSFSGFVNDLRNGVTAADAFTNSLDRIIDGLINMTIEAMFAKNALGGVISNMFGGMFVGGGAVTAHGGGKVGAIGARRRVSPALFANAPRLHNGLMPGEFPAILQRGEIVLPRTASRRGGSAPVNQSYTTGDINIDMSQSGMVAADSASAKQFGINVQKLIQTEMVRESRPGGLLRRVPV